MFILCNEDSHDSTGVTSVFHNKVKPDDAYFII